MLPTYSMQNGTNRDYDLTQTLVGHALWLAGDPRGERANLRYANLREADLRGADLAGADLFLASLHGANMRGVDLTDANLRRANLINADLRGADLRGADLEGADLTGADLTDANLVGATLPDYLVLPSTGPIVVYKKVKGAILTLFVPRDAMRTSCLRSRKCRVSKAKVVASTGDGIEWRSLHYFNFIYRLGEWIEPDGFDDDIRHECTHGIHAFATQAEAEDY